MVGHGGNSVGSYLADPTSPIPSHCASIVVTTTLRVNNVAKKKKILEDTCQHFFIMAQISISLQGLMFYGPWSDCVTSCEVELCVKALNKYNTFHTFICS